MTGDEIFRQAVEESKAVVTAAQTKPTKSAGRGRPALPRDANGNVIRPGNPASVSAQQQPVQQTSQPSQTAVGSGLDAKALLVRPFQLVSRLPAKRFDIPELQLDDQEAEAVAESVDKLFNVYFPDIEKLSPKTAAWVFGAFTCGSIFLGKYLIYAEVSIARLEHRRELEKARMAEMDRTHGVEIPAKPNPFKKPDAFSVGNS